MTFDRMLIILSLWKKRVLSSIKFGFHDVKTIFNGTELKKKSFCGQKFSLGHDHMVDLDNTQA
jgi:hypothetical protein